MTPRLPPWPAGVPALLPCLVLCATFAAPLAGQEGAAKRPAAPPWIDEYAAGSEEVRDRIVREASPDIATAFHRLLLEAGFRLAGGPSEDRAATTAMLLDFASRADGLSAGRNFADEVRQFAALPADRLRRRCEDLLQLNSLVSRWVSLHDEEQRRLAALQCSSGAESLLRPPEARSDRDLQRRCALVVEFTTRDGGAGSDAKMAAHREVVRIFEAHGLGGDRGALASRLDLAQALLAGDGEPHRLAEAERHLSFVRNALASSPSHLPMRGALASLELEYFQQRGFEQAAATAAEELSSLLPALEEDAQRLAVPQMRADRLDAIGDYAVQAAFALSASGRPEQARDVLAEALARPAGDPLLRARLHLLAAGAEETLGRPEEGDRHGIAALRQLERLPPEAAPAGLKAQALLTRASCAALRGRTGEASRHLAEAAPLVSCEPPDGDGLRLHQRRMLLTGLVAAMEGDLEGALSWNAEALRRRPGLPPGPEHVQAAWQRTRILLLLGETDEAVDSAQTAREWSHQVPVDRRWQTLCSDLTLAEALLTAGRAGDASTRLENALQTHREFLDGQPVLRGEGRRLLAEARYRAWRHGGGGAEAGLRIIEDIDRAVAELNSDGRGRFGAAERLTETLRVLEIRQEIEFHLGLPDDSSDAAKTAEKAWEQAIRDGYATEADSLVWEQARAARHVLHARLCDRLGRRDDAYSHYEKAAAIEDRLRHSLTRRAPDGLSARFETIHDRMAGLLLASAVESPSEARAEEALAFLERSRARSLRTLLAAARRDGQEREAGEDGGVHGGMRDAEALPVSALRAMMGKGRTALVYSMTTRGSFVIALAKDRIAVRVLPGDRTSTERLAVSLLQNLTDAPNRYRAEALRYFGHELFRTLLLPVADFLDDAGELIIVPDPAIEGLPFPLLRESAPESRSEGVSFREDPILLRRTRLQSLVYVPSLSTLAVLLESPAAPATRGALVVGAPAGLPDHPPLTHAAREVEEVAALYDDAASRKLLGREATASALVRSRPGMFPVIHFATHAEPADSRDRSAALLLSPEEGTTAPTVLGPPAVAGLRLQGTELVVLSACSSAAGRPAGLEGRIGLPRAFLAAGARSVVATVAPVPDGSSLAFMAPFHGRLRAGAGVARSLLEQQREFADSGEFSWPGAWAPYIALGVP